MSNSFNFDERHDQLFDRSPAVDYSWFTFLHKCGASNRQHPRESALRALLVLLEGLPLPSGAVKRNSAVPERVSDQTLVILRDGELGEPEVTLSPITYHWQHEASLEIFIANV